MRIIAGRFRSRVLLPPADEKTTRPITDRVKQSLFDILEVAGLLEGTMVYDCFSGTGSLGLEALSRGAERAMFFEADRIAQERLRKNISALGVEKQCTIVAGDIFKYFGTRSQADQPASIIFLDPPYRYLRERQDDLKQLAGALAGHLAPQGLLVFRHDAADALELSGFLVSDTRTYGGMILELMRRM